MFHIATQPSYARRGTAGLGGVVSNLIRGRRIHFCYILRALRAIFGVGKICFAQRISIVVPKFSNELKMRKKIVES